MSDKYGVQEFDPVHIQMMDFILLNPAATNEDIARAFNYSASWVGVLRASDSFKAQLAQKQAVISQDVGQEVKQKLGQLAKESLDKLLKKVVVEDNHHELRETAKLGLTGLGIISPKGAVSVVQDNRGAVFQSVSSDALARARDQVVARQKLIGESSTAPSAPLFNAQESPQG